MRLFATVREPTPASALKAVRSIETGHDGIEIRAEEWDRFDAAQFRAATSKPLIFTRRGKPFDAAIGAAALEGGFDLLDIEWSPDLDGTFIEAHRGRVVLSHHDFETVGDVEAIAEAMLAMKCRHTKIAVTPHSLAGNLRLLALLGARRSEGAHELTVIGMGERGLYSRILAPFQGSALAFVSADERSAAPGQLSLAMAGAIYGERRDSLSADHVFAIAGNPAGHSLSPSIHNPLFRKRGARAAYTIASVESFDEVAGPLLDGTISGLSVTAPFKVDAWRFARQAGASIGVNAAECESVNTLVRMRGGYLADNTDVDGFVSILAHLCRGERQRVALVGAGGTARAALVALDRAGVDVTIFNRTREKAEELARGRRRVAGLADLPRFAADIIINTTGAEAGIEFTARSGLAYIEAAYGSPSVAERHARYRAAGVHVIDGLELLNAQALRQHELFMKGIDDQR